jgi:hypothetical protein
MPVQYLNEGEKISNLLTPLNGVLIEKLIVTQLIKKLHALYGTQRFITVFTRAGERVYIFVFVCSMLMRYVSVFLALVRKAQNLSVSRFAQLFPR